jgi:inhibitor of cysteine peptidase
MPMDRERVSYQAFLLAVIIVGAGLLGALMVSTPGQATYSYAIKSFSSYDELAAFLGGNFANFSGNGGGWYLEDSSLAVPRSQKAGADNAATAYSFGGDTVDYSETNIQVEGVDEPDIVKTDGSYLYLVTSSSVIIMQGYPPEDAAIIAIIPMDENASVSNLFVYQDRLVLLGTSWEYPSYTDSYKGYYWWGGTSTTNIRIYDISQRDNPTLDQDIEVDGWYVDARMIDDYVYVISTESSYDLYYVLEDNTTFNIPQIRVDGETRNISAEDIYYADIPERLETMTHLLAVNLNTKEITQESYLMGSSHSMYMSAHNLFLVYTKYTYTYPLFRGGENEETTIIYKIAVEKGDISYTAQGEVPGRVLNQFSMDEYDGFFRIATTLGHAWNTDTQSTNNIYILDDALQRISELEDIAPGEEIYSARFMGEKAYLVTFKKIDPFFTIDLSDPYHPEILGKLKIPGYSDYLHPYDQDHIIGIGKETVEPLEEEQEWRNIDFAWYQGLKIALFDVTDFNNPQEIAKVVLGDRGTSSPALDDHKAFLFDKDRELLVIPVALYTIDDEIKQQQGNYTGSLYGEYTFQGAYVYQLNLEEGFTLQGRVTHMDEGDMMKSGFYPEYASSIMRSLYIGDYLYTISENMVKINDLTDSSLSEVATIDLQ